MRNFPSKRRAVENQQRVTSLEEREAVKTETTGRRFFSAPTQTLGAPIGDAPVAKKNWFGRTMSVFRHDKSAPAAPVNNPMQQQSPPGHPAPSKVNLAARRAAPAPPRIDLPTEDEPAGPSPPFPHPSTFANSPGPVKQNFFARILGVKPVSRVVHTTYNPAKLQREIVECLNRWDRNDLGVRATEDDRRARVIRARVANRNVLGLKGVRFRIEIREDENNGSRAVFHLERGSNSSHNRVVDEYEQLLRTRNVLVEVRNPSRLSAYAL